VHHPGKTGDPVSFYSAERIQLSNPLMPYLLDDLLHLRLPKVGWARVSQVLDVVVRIK